MTELDDLLARAEAADPIHRIELRDTIAAHGEAAIEAMTDWLSEDRFAAFAIRVLERIGREATNREAVIEVLTAVDREELPPHLASDVDRALDVLGWKPPKAASRRIVGGPRPKGTPGVAGRGYWVMRTSPWERPFLWGEALAGRLRQGWGTEDDQDLELIAEVVRRGGQLSDSQREARRALRMLTGRDDGMRLGDLVITPNLPTYARLSVFRVAGSYSWSRVAAHTWGERFGHVLPVELVAADIDRRSPVVSDGLRAMLRPQTRLYSISAYGGDVEQLVGARRGNMVGERIQEVS